MASSDLMSDGGNQPRSLSEQLRILEQQLDRLSKAGSTQPADPLTRLPTSLGRPLGLAPLPRAPLLGVPDRYDDENDDGEPAGAPPLRDTLQRRAIIGAFSLLLLASTALVPSLLWHPIVPDASEPESPAVIVMRTEQFAHAALELRNGQLVQPTPAADSTPETSTALAPPLSTVAAVPEAAPEPAMDAPREQAHRPMRPTATLTVAESDLSRLSLPMLVSGGGPAWKGSAVVIDGLPTEARVSHGMKIAPDTWTIGIADVGTAVLSLPRTTPDRLELSVRVLGADSHELAVSSLQIHVLRTPGRPAPIAPAAIFEPAAAEMERGQQLDPAPVSRQAVKVDRTRRPASPVTPAKPPFTTRIAQDDKKPADGPERPTASSSWASTVLPPASAPSLAPMPKWAPFSDR